MSAQEKLVSVLSGNFNLEFENVEILRNGTSIAKIKEDTIYLRQGGPFGGIMAVLNYSYAINDIQAYGAMRNFSYGHYDFFTNWQIINEHPLTIIQHENDSINYIKLTAVDTPSQKDIIMEFEVGEYIIRCSNCRYIF